MLAMPAWAETPGSWDDWTTYSFTTPEAPNTMTFPSGYTSAYGLSDYPKEYTSMWSPTWQHFDNLDHIRPTTGVPAMDAVGKWNLPGRAFPGPAAM
eukprot:CAMPEP_0206230722 /NCGR_PEP_ID=MMETSP0047_2-20121206/10427_1 /ASSEMBLY_ACC=CAM_ASM_000192 /TAXON_ID=195065 /ORGANISM="Chroomonas mesostigmatica_cf, Strain CCMP1168" /LENGTH=95 /DNA_ID=CAMNT_0053654197 /DNA_START=62 /DNA_END=349 /DNA_ORIENTATION=-